MRKIAVFASALLIVSPVPVYAETKTVEAYCEVPQEKVVTNVVSVTINVDTSSGDPWRIAKSMAEKIGYKASETLYNMGINPDGGVYCRFSDATLSFDVNENKPLDYLRSLPTNPKMYRNHRLITVSGFGGPSQPALPKLASVQSGKTKKDVTNPPVVSKGPTPNQLKYQRELEAYNARLAEIDKIKADTAAKHSADRASAEMEMARHRQQLAVADATRRQYQSDLAAHQQRVKDMESKQDRETKVEWREAVVVCTLRASDGQTRFGNWRCDGPLQMTYAKLGNPGQTLAVEALVPLSQACGGSREAVRDLGMVGDARLLGCSYGIHPKSTSGLPLDAAAKHGIGFVPGRAIYRCPAYQSGCRSQ